MIFRPLHIAASRHLVDTCELLLIKGASVSVTDNQGLNPVLATATTDDAVTCLTMLLEAVKMETQTSRLSRTSVIHAARRSVGSIGKTYQILYRYWKFWYNASIWIFYRIFIKRYFLLIIRFLWFVFSIIPFVRCLPYNAKRNIAIEHGKDCGPDKLSREEKISSNFNGGCRSSCET